MPSQSRIRRALFVRWATNPSPTKPEGSSLPMYTALGRETEVVKIPLSMRCPIIHGIVGQTAEKLGRLKILAVGTIATRKLPSSGLTHRSGNG
jgi:hypothetical protein